MCSLLGWGLLFLLCWPLALVGLILLVVFKLIILPFKLIGYLLLGMVGLGFILLLPLLFLQCCGACIW